MTMTDASVLTSGLLLGLNDRTGLDAALALADAGVAVFPCQASGKRPLTSRGYLAATTSEHTIRRWLRDAPDANLGVPTGKRFDVLDIDCKNGRDGMGALYRLRDAGLLRGAFAVANTPSGGLHVYLPPSGEGNHASKHGLDYRGRGGYVLVAPSRIDGVQYQYSDVDTGRSGPPLHWQAVKDLLDPPRVPVRASEVPHGSLDALEAFVARLTPGRRNSGLHWAAHRALDDGLDPWKLTEAALRTGLSQSEVRATIRSAERGPQ